VGKMVGYCVGDPSERALRAACAGGWGAQDDHDSHRMDSKRMSVKKDGLSQPRAHLGHLRVIRHS